MVLCQWPSRSSEFPLRLVTSVQFSAIFSPSVAASACEIGGLSLSASVSPVFSAQRLSTLQLEEHKAVVFVRVLAWSGRCSLRALFLGMLP